jgi:DeoR/GlpR family transcriptional regulator of sugar metabolism
METKADSCATGKRDTVGRRWAIVEQVQRNQHLSVAKLSERFGVSEATIRRDLAYLEQMGLLERVHGGAQALSLAEQTFLFDARLLQNRQIKCAIGRIGAGLVRPGDIIFLDSGTTVLEVARSVSPALLDSGGLTVITRSLVIASEFRNRPSTRLVVLGGVYGHDFDTFVGGTVEQALRGMHADTLFIGTDGVTAERGLTTDNVLEAGLYPIMVQCADRVVVVADSSKIGANQLQAILPLDQIHVFITDTDAPDGFVNMLRETGVEVILVPRS